MSDMQWYAERDDRMRRYGARPLDRERWIVLRADPPYASSYAGQVAVLTAANLLGRMTPSVALDLPAVPITNPLPWVGHNLLNFILQQLNESNPHGRYCPRRPQDSDSILHLGPNGSSIVSHGAGWYAYGGPEPSPLPTTDDFNPVGPAMASILSVARLFVHELSPPPNAYLLNAFNWTHTLCPKPPPFLPIDLDLGKVWVVGIGSVGTAILYFLTFITRNFSGVLFDMDIVKRHNITRSPIFTEAHVGQFKARVTKNYLDECGVGSVIAHNCALDESSDWSNRQPGTPDILIPTANERNVRYYIETLFPPIQIYGTTGRNWQSSVLRHIPFQDPCSCCIFPAGAYQPTSCATTPTQQLLPDTVPQIDAALPFLSFSAGLMAVAEILKFTFTGYPLTPNRAHIYFQPEPRVCSSNAIHRKNCVCENRSKEVYRKMFSNSRFSSLSGF